MLEARGSFGFSPIKMLKYFSASENFPELAYCKHVYRYLKDF